MNRLCALMLLLMFTGCVSADGAGEKWDEYVADHDACETADDCVVIYPGCPLGCWAAVSKEHQEDAERRADKLIASYERGGRNCAYGCLAAGPVQCVEGACSVTEATPEELTCEDSECGDACTVCTDPEDCPDEFCQADGLCAEGEPVCE